jgi:hypothetical protein
VNIKNKDLIDFGGRGRNVYIFRVESDSSELELKFAECKVLCVKCKVASGPLA